MPNRWTIMDNSITNIKLNVWYHMSIVFNNTNVKIYLNGDIVKEYNTPNVMQNCNDWILGMSGDKARYSNSNISQFMIWDIPLSSAEIKYVYNKTIPILMPMSGIVGWFDANDPNSNGVIPPNNTEIILWRDKSGNENHFGSKVPGKYINGSIKFSGSWYMSYKPQNYPIDVYIVVKLDQLDVPSDIISIGELALDNFNSLTYGEYKPKYWSNGSNNYSRTKNANADVPENSNGPLLMGWSISNNDFKIYRNGKQIMSSTEYTWSANNPFLRLGSRHPWKTNQTLNGNIYEIIVYNRKLNESERKQVESYLSNKWQL